MKVNKNKWVVGATSAALVASAIVPVASAASFSDIEKNDHKEAILALAEAGIVSGFADGTFKPNAAVTRGNVTKLLGKWLVSEGYEVPENFETEGRFTDLSVDFSDKELVKYAALVKDEKVFNGSNNQLMHTREMNREQMALVLVRAIKTVYGVDLVADYKAANFESKITDLEKATDDSNREAITALEYAKLTTVTAFNPKNSLTRGQFASFLNRTIVNLAKEEVVELTVKSVTVTNATTLEVTLSDDTKHTVTLEKALPENEETTVDFVIDEKTYSAKVTYVVDKLKIGSVEAINSKTVEVNFTKAIDADFIREAERNGNYFAIYKDGDSIRGNVAQSTSISFAADGKSATFVVGNDIQSGEKYHVALLDGSDHDVANVVLSFGPTELRKAADQPNLEVSSVSDKITLKFNTKMKSDALKVDNYSVYDDGGKKIGDLQDFVTAKKGQTGEWLNAITKTTVEFTLDKEGTQKLLAGKTYKIKLTNSLETDDNKTLSKDNLVITIKTPTVDEAAPKVSTARVIKTKEIVLVFDKDVTALNLNSLNNLVEIKTATGKKVVTKSITGSVEDLAPNEVKLTLDTDENLDSGTTYNIEVPANLVTNAVFPNATNKATSNIKATAQDSKAITSVKAQLVPYDKNRKVANLVLTFDQRPTLKSVQDAISTGAIKIFDGTDEYVSKLATSVKYLGSDTTGKTVVIGGVNADRAFLFNDESFAPMSGESYAVEIAAGAIYVDSFGSKLLANQSKIKATINGVSVSAPVIDRVTLESADQMVVEFKEAIDSTIDLNKITVAGYEADQNNFYTASDLTGSKNFAATVSGNKLTLTAKSGVKFATGADGNGEETGNNLISFAKDAIVSKDSAISIDTTNIAEGTVSQGKLDDVKFVDNAAPVLLYAKEADKDELTFTFTETIEVEGNVAAQFRTGGDAAKSSVGVGAAKQSNTLNVTFTDAWKDGDNTTLLEVTSEYRIGQTIYISDAFGNKVATTKLTGVKKGIIQVLPPVVNTEKLIEAIDAVTKAEKSKDQADVEAAKTFVNALPEVQAKTDLLNKLEAVTAAVISNVSISSDNKITSKAVKGDKITLTFTTNKKVEKTEEFKINGKSIDELVEPTNESGPYTYTVTYTVVEEDVAGEVKFQINVKTKNGVLSSAVETTKDLTTVIIVTN